MADTADAASDYLAALERLVNGKPRDKKNQELASQGKLAITPSSVAREADRSRTPIGKKEDCDHPEVRAAILKAGGQASGARSRRAANRRTIDELTVENRILQLRIGRMATLLVDASAELRQLETTVFKLRDSLAAKLKADPPRPGLLGLRDDLFDPQP